MILAAENGSIMETKVTDAPIDVDSASAGEPRNLPVLERHILDSVSQNILSTVPEEFVDQIPAHFDSKRSWIILLCGYLMQIVVMGLMHTFGIFYISFLRDFRRSEALTAFIGSSAYGLNMFVGFIIGILQSKMQTRFIMIIGCILCAFSCFISSFARSLEVLFATFSFIFGIGSSMCYTPTICLPQTYFLKYTSLATGIMMAGSSSGTLVMSPIVQYLIVNLGWRMTFRIFSILCLGCIPLMALITPPPTKTELHHTESRRILSHLRIWRNRVFIIWASAVTIAMFAYNTPGVHLIAVAGDKGVPTDQGAYCLLVLGLCASIGRVLWGKILQTGILNWTNAHQCALIMTGTAHTFLPICNNFGSIMAYVVIIGLLDGGYTVLLPLLTSQFLGADRAPVVWGFVISAASISFMLGPAVSGLLRTRTGRYDLSFHVIGLAMIAAGLLEFLLPWAKRTANPEKALISVFSEIHPNARIEDVEEFPDDVSDEGMEMYNVYNFKRKKDISVASSGLRSKVSFSGCASPRLQLSKVSQYNDMPVSSNVERTARRRCISESIGMADVLHDSAKLLQVVRNSTSAEQWTTASAVDLPTAETEVGSQSNDRQNEAISRHPEPDPAVHSLLTVHENEILKIVPNSDQKD